MQEVYLLKNKASSPLFRKYSILMERCRKEGEFLSFENDFELLSCYERDAQTLYTKFPLLVFQPYKTCNIAPFLKACYDLNIAVTARCGGTGLFGSCISCREGIIVLTGHLKRVMSYDRAKGVICVEPGVTSKQINEFVQEEGWVFPLSMATEGVAGIAGCLSTQAKGYHQQHIALFDTIEQVILVNGKGEVQEVPPFLVCGAEGAFGIIIEIKIQLTQNFFSQYFECEESWEKILFSLPRLRSLNVLTSLVRTKNRFFLELKGEDFRMSASVVYLKELFPSFKAVKASFFDFFPTCRQFIIIQSVFRPFQICKAMELSLETCNFLELECHQLADLLSGSVHFIIQSNEEKHMFRQKVEKFLKTWTHFVSSCQGEFRTCYGMGFKRFSFLTEETERYFFRLQKAFDPKGLFCQEN